MNRSQLRKQVLDALPPFYQKRMGKFAAPITSSVVDSTLDTIMQATIEGERVDITGFGTFEPSVREPHLVFCNLSSPPGYQVTRPYVRVYLRPCAAWKDKLAQRVKDQFADQSQELEKLAQAKSRARQGGTDGEVRVRTRKPA
jgi:nucleoid DNA-binding protein